MTPVFIHGAGFTGESFAQQLAAFTGAHAPNLPGHDASGCGRSIADFAAWVEEFIQSAGIAQPVLCGHSMGGAVALEVALRARIPVRALVLLGSGARLRVAPALLSQLETDFEGGAQTVASYCFAELTDERAQWVAQCMQRVGRDQTLRDYHACDAFDVLDRLGEISVPLLALTGERDVMTPPKYAHALACRVPNSQERIVAGAGHFAMVELPEETNAAVRTFISGVA